MLVSINEFLFSFQSLLLSNGNRPILSIVTFCKLEALIAYNTNRHIFSTSLNEAKWGLLKKNYIKCLTCISQELTVFCPSKLTLYVKTPYAKWCLLQFGSLSSLSIILDWYIIIFCIRAHFTPTTGSNLDLDNVGRKIKMSNLSCNDATAIALELLWYRL